MHPLYKWIIPGTLTRPVVLYGYKPWAMLKEVLKVLEDFERRVLRIIFGGGQANVGAKWIILQECRTANLRFASDSVGKKGVELGEPIKVIDWNTLNMSLESCIDCNRIRSMILTGLYWMCRVNCPKICRGIFLGSQTDNQLCQSPRFKICYQH